MNKKHINESLGRLCALLLCVIVFFALHFPVLADDFPEGVSEEFSDENLQDEAAYDVTVIIEGTEQSAPGKEINIAVRAESDKPISIVQFDLMYDSERLELIGVSDGGALGNESATINTSVTGDIRFVWDSVNPAVSGEALMIGTFKVIGEEDSTATFWLDESQEAIFAAEDEMLTYTAEEMTVYIRNKSDLPEDVLSADEKAETQDIEALDYGGDERPLKVPILWIVIVVMSVLIVVLIIMSIIKYRKNKKRKHKKKGAQRHEKIT